MTQPMYPEPGQPDPAYPQQPYQQPGANPYGAPQQPYYGGPQNPYGAQDPYAAQNPYAQQQQAAQYPYQQVQGQQAQGQQPYGYQYDPGAGGYGYGVPMPAQRPDNGSRNAMIGVLVAVAVLAVGVSVYWFGFHNQSTNGAPVGFGSTHPTATVSASPQPPTDQPSAADSATPDVLGTSDDVAALRALMATMTDPGCHAAFSALITFEQAAQIDADDDTALLSDYDTAIASLTDAQSQAEDQAKADAIGRVVTDWKAYTAALAAGGTPSDDTMSNDGQQLAAACLS
jgi:hypothetical protein